jgi:hypothetical protein
MCQTQHSSSHVHMTIVSTAPGILQAWQRVCMYVACTQSSPSTAGSVEDARPRH